jgi:hypothetical protein
MLQSNISDIHRLNGIDRSSVKDHSELEVLRLLIERPTVPERQRIAEPPIAPKSRFKHSQPVIVKRFA